VYDDRVLVLEGLQDEPSPATYDLCGPHADRTGPPYGWEFRDERRPADLDPDRPRDLGGPDTVAVLAQALKRDRQPAAPSRGAAPPGRQRPLVQRSPQPPQAAPAVSHGEEPVDGPVATAPAPRPRPVLAARPDASPGQRPTTDLDGVRAPARDDAAEELAALAAVLAEIANDDELSADPEDYLRQIEAIADAAPSIAAADDAAPPPPGVAPPDERRAAGGGARAEAW
jgi:hypothetical protein